MRFFSALPFVALFAGAFAAPSAAPSSLVKRCDTCRSVPTIVADLQVKLDSPCGELSAITVDANIEVKVKAVVDVMVSIVADAVAEIKLLQGQNSSTIFGVEGGAIVSVEVLATSLCALFSLVITACASVLAVAGVKFVPCQVILVVIAKATADLCVTIFSVCGLAGLQASFFAGIYAIVPLCYSLNLFDFLNIFGLGLSASTIVGGVCAKVTGLLSL